MIDGPDLTLRVDGPAGPYLIIRPPLVERAKQALRDHDIAIDANEAAADVVNLGVFMSLAQAVDSLRRVAAEHGWTLREPTLDEALTSAARPARVNASGVGLVGASRVTMASIVHAFRGGSEPSEIVDRFPSLSLADVYGAIAFYLANRERVDAALARLDAEAEVICARIKSSPGQQSLRRAYLAHADAQVGASDAATVVR